MRANPIQNRLPAIHGKSVFRKQMFGKLYRIPAIQMFKRSATETLCMEMVAAIAMFANVLIARFRGLFVTEFPHDVARAKFGQVTVNAALPRFASMHGKTNFFRREMLVGVAGEKFQKPFSSLRFILLHLFRELL